MLFIVFKVYSFSKICNVIIYHYAKKVCFAFLIWGMRGNLFIYLFIINKVIINLSRTSRIEDKVKSMGC